MEKILSQIGYDIASTTDKELTRTLDLTSIPVSVKSKYSLSTPLLDFLLLHLRFPMNSMFFVGEDIDLIERYINALAVFMTKSSNLKSKIYELIETYEIEDRQKFTDTYTRDGFYRAMEHRIAWNFYAVDTSKLLSLAKTNDDWDKIIPKLVDEAQKKRALLVLSDLHILYDKTNPDYHNLARHIFFSTRGQAKLTFIAPMTWKDYVEHIEHGQMTNLIQHRRPIFFSPRPMEFKPHERWNYDDDYVYSANLD